MIRLSRTLAYANGDPVPVVHGSGSRVNATATAASTAAAALPTAARVLLVRATADVWLRLGESGVGAAAADANSMLFLAGEALISVPLIGDTSAPVTHFRVMRVGSADVPVQLERVDTF